MGVLRQIVVGMTIDEIEAAAGGTRKLAELLNVHWSTVCGFKKTKRGLLPIHHAQVVSEALDIPLWELRPDVWAEPVRKRRALATA